MSVKCSKLESTDLGEEEKKIINVTAFFIGLNSRKIPTCAKMSLRKACVAWLLAGGLVGLKVFEVVRIKRE